MILRKHDRDKDMYLLQPSLLLLLFCLYFLYAFDILFALVKKK